MVTNGDQTDTIVEKGDFRQGCLAREYEPDAPNYTPRISCVINPDGSFEISILKHHAGRCLREFFCYEGCDEGVGYFISTYQGDGNPLPTFAGEPVEVTMPEPDEVWAALNADNKVSLYANVDGRGQHLQQEPRRLGKDPPHAGTRAQVRAATPTRSPRASS